MAVNRRQSNNKGYVFIPMSFVFARMPGIILIIFLGKHLQTNQTECLFVQQLQSDMTRFRRKGKLLRDNSNYDYVFGPLPTQFQPLLAFPAHGESRNAGVGTS